MKAILVAEDDPSARELVRDALSEVPEWVVTAVEDGAKLLEMLGTVNPSLIVLDVNMPGLNGLEVYRLLRQSESSSSVPVLFLTAEDRAQAPDLEGPFSWLSKPFDVDDLITMVAELLGVEPPEILG